MKLFLLLTLSFPLIAMKKNNYRTKAVKISSKKHTKFFFSTKIGIISYNPFDLNLDPILFYSKFKTSPQLAYSFLGGVSWNSISSFLTFQHVLPAHTGMSRNSLKLSSKLSTLSLSLDGKINTPTKPISSYIGGGIGLGQNTLDKIKYIINSKHLGTFDKNTSYSLLWKSFIGIETVTKMNLKFSLQLEYTTHGSLKSSNKYEDHLLKSSKVLNNQPQTKEYLGSTSVHLSAIYFLH